MGELAVRQPHLGRDTIGMLCRIVDAGGHGLPQDDIEPYLLVRLLRCGYVRRKEDASPLFIATPTGIARAQFETIQAKRRQDESERREIIRGRIQAMAGRLAIDAAPAPLPPSLRDLPGYRERILPPFQALRPPAPRARALLPAPASRANDAPRATPEDALQVIRDAELRARRDSELPTPETGELLIPQHDGAQAVHVGRLPQPRARQPREIEAVPLPEEKLPAIVVTEVADRYRTSAAAYDSAFDSDDDTHCGGAWSRAALTATVAAAALLVAHPLAHQDSLIKAPPVGTHQQVQAAALRLGRTPPRDPANPPISNPAHPAQSIAATNTASATAAKHADAVTAAAPAPRVAKLVQAATPAAPAPTIETPAEPHPRTSEILARQSSSPRPHAASHQPVPATQAEAASTTTPRPPMANRSGDATEAPAKPESPLLALVATPAAAASISATPPPAVTSPAIAHPAVMSPAVTKAAIASSAVTPPAVTRPAVTTAVFASPVVTSPAIASPAIASPTVTSPAVTSPVIASSVIAPPIVAPPIVSPPIVAPPIVATPLITSPQPADAIPASLPPKPPPVAAPIATPAVALLMTPAPEIAPEHRTQLPPPASPEPRPQAATRATRSPTSPPRVLSPPLPTVVPVPPAAPREHAYVVPAVATVMPMPPPDPELSSARLPPQDRFAAHRPDHPATAARPRHPEVAVAAHAAPGVAPPGVAQSDIAASPDHDDLSQVMARLRQGTETGDPMVDRLNTLSLEAALHGRRFVPPGARERALTQPTPPPEIEMP